MSLVNELLNNSYQDTQLLIGNDEKGDVFDKYRDVDFIFIADEEKKAETIIEFISDNQYGDATLSEANGQFEIRVTINMPINQQILLSISALMTCLAELFGVDYDGWGCEIQKNNIQNSVTESQRS